MSASVDQAGAAGVKRSKSPSSRTKLLDGAGALRVLDLRARGGVQTGDVLG